MSEEDHCIEDPPVPKQNFCCLSLVYPELSVVEERALFMAEEFIKNYISNELRAVSEQASRFIEAEVARRLTELREQTEVDAKGEEGGDGQVYRVAHEWLKGRLARILPDQDTIFNASTRVVPAEPGAIKDAYIMFHAKHHEELEAAASKMFGGGVKPTVSGLKIRGSYQTEEEARKRASYLQREIEPAADVFVAEIGKWLPLTPNIDSIEDHQYAQKELNQMVGQMRERQVAAQQFQRERIEASKRQAQAAGTNIRVDRARASVRARLERRRRDNQSVTGGVTGGETKP